MLFRQFFDTDSSTYTYLIADPVTRAAALIDPVREQLDRDMLIVEQLQLQLAYVLETHCHADHITAAGLLRERTGAKTVCSKHGGATCIDLHLDHGEGVAIGALQLTVLVTPGHTPDSISFYLPGRVLTGDALLVRGTGRTDFQGGDPGQLYDSITSVLFSLPDDTLVYPAHDYKGHTCSSIGEERRHNPRLFGKSRDEFIYIMNSLHLPPPKKLHLAVPANQACGRDLTTLPHG